MMMTMMKGAWRWCGVEVDVEIVDDNGDDDTSSGGSDVDYKMT